MGEKSDLKKRKAADVLEPKVKKDKKDKKEKKHKDKKDKSKKEKTERREKKKDNSEKTEKTETSVEVIPADAVSGSDVEKFLKDNEITIENPLKTTILPALEFSLLKSTIEKKILKVLSEFEKPTPIQSATWPCILSGRDTIGVAETGSGKTFAFGVPAVNHIVRSGKTDKLSVLVVSPTRELASQIYDNMVKLTDATGLKCTCIYGGVSKDDQRRQVKTSHCVIATPGRLLDLLEEGSIDLSAIDYLVLDEADRMLEKGFEEDIKRIMRSVNATRQTVMFTATWPKEVRELAASFLKDPVRITVGDRDELSANKRITQIVEVMEPYDKEKKLIQLLTKYTAGSKANDKILIFALYKKEAARVERTLNYKGFQVAALHGDLTQQQRTQALENFKSGKCNLLLATDVAARGLDIPNVKVVINLTFPLTIEDYVHRIGRTGRAGKTGIAHTLFTEHEKHLSGALMNILRGADQEVPSELLKFGGHTKKKEHSVYGAFYKNVDPTQKAKKIKFD